MSLLLKAFDYVKSSIAFLMKKLFLERINFIGKLISKVILVFLPKLFKITFITSFVIFLFKENIA